MYAPFQPLGWHSCLEDTFLKSECGSKSLGVYPNSDLPHVQFCVPSGTAVSGGLIHFQDQGTTTPLSFVNESIEDRDYYSFNGNIFASVPNQIAYYQVEVNGVTMYSDPFKIVSSSCLKYKLEWSSCSISGLNYDGIFDQVMYFERIDYGAPSISETLEGKTNGFGEVSVSIARQKKFTNAIILTNCHTHCGLKGLVSHSDVTLTNLKSGEVKKLSEISVSEATNDCEFLTTVTWFEAVISSDQCCESRFSTDIFQDECDNSTPGEPCPDDFEALLEPDGSGNLIGSANNAPSGTLNYYIYIDGDLQGNVSSINLADYGLYELLVISEDGCEARDSYMYNDPCANFEVELVKNGLKIDGVVSGVPMGETVQIQICDSDGNVVGNSFPTVVDEEGVYTVKVETESCNFITLCPLLSPLECDFDFEITKDENGLLSPTFNPVSAGTLSYQWLQNTEGSSNVLVSSSSSYQPTETGYYTLIVTSTIDGQECLVEKGYMCIIEDDCLNVVIKEMPTQNITLDTTAIVDAIINNSVDIQPIVDALECLDVNIKNDCINVVIKEPEPCPTGTVERSCVACVLSYAITGYTGYAWTLNDNPYTPGDSITLTEDGTWTLVGTFADCPTVTDVYEFDFKSAGSDTSKTINKP